MEEPLISVIMPSYNAQSYIGEAIKSILCQTYQNFELIIIDDSSTDGTCDILNGINDKRCKIYYNEINRGIAYTRNKAVRLAKGKYIAFMDDDDVAIINRLEREVEFLEKNHSIGIVGGKAQICDSNLKPRSYIKEVWHNPNLIKVAYLFQSVMWNSTVMMRKEIIDEKGILFRNNCLGMEDYDFYMRWSKETKLTNLDELFLKYRMYNENTTTRIRLNKHKERMDKFDSIQRESFILSGFNFSEDEWKDFSMLFIENPVNYTHEEIKMMMIVLRKIVLKAKEIGFEPIKELEFYCRWRLGKAVERTNYWLS